MKRRPVDSWFWELFVKACGTKCCACGKTGIPIERGHIIPHSLGGSDSLDNLIPLCVPCNRKFLKNQTLDRRPADWREAFFLLLGHYLRPQILCSITNSLRSAIQPGQRSENARLISWDNGDFGAANMLFAQSRSMTIGEADALVRRLVIESQERDPAPRLPFKARHTEMVGLAMQNRQEVFWQAGLAFLDAESWIPNVPGHDIERDSWRSFCENFYIYEKKWSDRVEAERKAAKKLRDQKVEYEHRQRISDFRSVLSIPADWAGLTDADRELIVALKAHEEARDVTGGDAGKSAELRSRYAQHVRSERQQKAKMDDFKNRLIEVITTARKKRAITDAWVNAHPNRFENLYWGIRNADSEEKLFALEKDLSQMFKEADEWDGSTSEGGCSFAEFLENGNCNES